MSRNNPPLSPEAREARKRRAREELVAITRLMDSAFAVPMLGTRVGLNALLGLVPAVGDVLSAAIGFCGSSPWPACRKAACAEGYASSAFGRMDPLCTV